MADTWQTIEQAAVTLGLSVRTLNRHITAGKIQSRLFEGRREVLLPSSEKTSQDQGKRVASAPASSSNEHSGKTAEAVSEQVADGGGQGQTFQKSVGGANDSNATSNGQAAARSPDSSDWVEGNARTADHPREHLTAELIGEKSLDMQTMLALADSIDDKASLAVAAYQTLARYSENQVQSLRRVAFGAWAAVGVMALAVIVGVGWGTYRLTTAEISASQLKEEVSRQSRDATQIAAQRDQLSEELDGQREKKAELRGELQQAKYELASMAASIMKNGAVQTPPHAAFEANPVGAPASQPVGSTTSSPEDHGGGGGTFFPPSTHPIGRHAGANNPKSTYMTHSAEAFDPK